MASEIFVPVTSGPADQLLIKLNGLKSDAVQRQLDSANGDHVGFLEMLGIVNSQGLTEVGLAVAPLVSAGIPCHLSRVMVAAAQLNCLPDAVRLVAMFSAKRSLRYRPAESNGVGVLAEIEAQRALCKQADEAHRKTVRLGFKSDLGLLLGAYDHLVALQRDRNVTAVQEYCEANFLHAPAFFVANRQHERLLGILDRLRYPRVQDKTSEDALILALLQGLPDWVVEYRNEHRRDFAWCHQQNTGGWLVAPGSNCYGRDGDIALVALFMHQCMGKRLRRSETVTLMTETVELTEAVLDLARQQRTPSFNIERSDHTHRIWHRDGERVMCDEEWRTLDGRKCFSRSRVPAPASVQAGEAFAWSLIGRDDDDFLADRQEPDPIVTASRELCRRSGGRFPRFEKHVVASVLALKLAHVTTWAEVQRLKAAGKLALTWADFGDHCGFSAERLAALRAEVEVDYPSLVTVGAVSLPLTYHQRADRPEMAYLTVNANDAGQLAALAALSSEHFPACLATREVFVTVGGIGQHRFVRGAEVSGSVSDLDDLRRRAATEINRPEKPTLPQDACDLVREVVVIHPGDRQEMLYVTNADKEATTDRDVGLQRGWAVVTLWLRQQAQMAASPHQLEPELQASAMALVEPDPKATLPNAFELRRLGEQVTTHVQASVTPRIEERKRLLAEVQLLALHAQQCGRASEVAGALKAIELALGSQGLNFLLARSVLDGAREQFGRLQAALPVLDEDGSRLLVLCNQLAVLRRGIKDVGGELRTERRDGCARVEDLLRRKDAKAAESALSALQLVYTETARLASGGHTRRLKGGKG